MMLLSDIYLWLAYSRVSTRKINKLLDNIPPAELWNSFADGGRYALDDGTMSKLKRTRNVEFIERAKQYLETNHIGYVTRVDPLFPTGLAQSEVDPPFALFYKGDPNLLRTDCLAVVGTRNASQYGKYVTDKFVEELSERFTIVSGLATGIDGFAHRAALKSGGKTIAVLGSGLFNVSPASNIGLFDEICRTGLVFSEYPPDVHGTVYSFPQRNRLVSGISKGVLVVEAATKSGALITAGCAAEQGRDVFAVPGDIDKQRSVGTNNLIKQGAVAVTDGRDIMSYYGATSEKKKHNTVELNFDEEGILHILEGGERSFDSLAESSGLSVPELNAVLSSLMIYGLIHERSKNMYSVTLR